MTDMVVADHVGKMFKRYHPERPQTIKEWVIGGFRRSKALDRFWVLRDISFSVAPGRVFGIIGSNGSGKSTLLHLLGGAFPPDEGSVQVRGRVGALIDLGAGFHFDLTGRENVFIYGIIAGLTRGEVRKRFDSIISFAELEDFIDSPYRTYSTGMQMRLSFSAAIHTNPEIMLIDEVLAVGDLNFQKKCLEHMAECKAQGCTMVIVSHDLDKIKELCDEVLWIRAGGMAACGNPQSVIEDYTTAMSKETRRRMPKDVPVRRSSTGIELRMNENRFGSLEMEIVDVRLLDKHGMNVHEIANGDSLCVEIEYLALQPIARPVFGVTISDDMRQDFFDVSSDAAELKLSHVEGRGRIQLLLDRLDLRGGNYYVDVGVYQQNWEYAYDYHWHLYPLAIQAKRNTKGILHPPHCWKEI